MESILAEVPEVGQAQEQCSKHCEIAIQTDEIVKIDKSTDFTKRVINKGTNTRYRKVFVSKGCQTISQPILVDNITQTEITTQHDVHNEILESNAESIMILFYLI